MATIIIKCDPSRAIKGLDRITPTLMKGLLVITKKHLQMGVDILKSKMDERYPNRSTTKLALTTGKLKRSVKVVSPEITATNISGAIMIGDETTPYAKVHIASPRGKETIIKPKTSKMLAIPTRFARTGSRGVPRGKPTDSIWGVTRERAGKTSRAAAIV